MWLNEGLATYLSLLTHFESNKLVFLIYNVEDWDTFYALNGSPDAYRESDMAQIPIYVKGRGVDSDAYKVVYEKASNILRMISAVMGEKAFRSGIQKYLSIKQYQSAVTDDLWNALSEKVDNNLFQNISMKKAFDGWATQCGYPLVTVTRCYNVTCNQWIQFHQQPIDYCDAPAFWNIPLSYVAINGTSKITEFEDTKPKLLMEATAEHLHRYSGSTPLNENSALIVNIRNSGIYQVNFDEKNWKLIGKMLRHNHMSIHTANRLQIVNSLHFLVRKRKINRKLPLCIGEYLTVSI